MGNATARRTYWEARSFALVDPDTGLAASAMATLGTWTWMVSGRNAVLIASGSSRSSGGAKRAARAAMDKHAAKDVST